MSKFNTSIAAPDLRGRADMSKDAKRPALESFDSIVFGGASETFGIADGEHIAFFPKDEYVKNAANMVFPYVRKSNGREYKGSYLAVVSYRLDADGNVVNAHTKWFDPASLIKRCFDVTATPNEGESFVEQTGLRAHPCATDFNDTFATWQIGAVVSHLIDNNLGVVGATSSDKVWLGYWLEGVRQANKYYQNTFIEVSTEDVPDDLFEA